MLPEDERHGSGAGYSAHRREGTMCDLCKHAHAQRIAEIRAAGPSRLKNNAARLEDIHWMAETGENASGAAERLGITFKALEQWARRRAPDAWSQLIARNPRDHNQRDNRRNQWSAA